MTTCKPGDVVDVPFPFIDAPDKKLRPALVVSDTRIQQTSGAIVLMLVTSAERNHWETDIMIDDWQSAGLHKVCPIGFPFKRYGVSVIVPTIGELLARSCHGRLPGKFEHELRAVAALDADVSGNLLDQHADHLHSESG